MPPEAHAYAPEAEAARHEHEHEHRIVPLKVYFSVFTALLVLTAVTVWIAFQDLGPLNTITALGIAGLKALLVILFFMHVRYSPRMIWIFASAGFLWLALLLGLLLADYQTRGWLG